MGRISGVVHGYVLSRDCESSRVLKLKQRAMTMMDHVTRFTELVQFVDDYVAIDLVKVR